jgi:hypothetical protein
MSLFIVDDSGTFIVYASSSLNRSRGKCRHCQNANWLHQGCRSHACRRRAVSRRLWPYLHIQGLYQIQIHPKWFIFFDNSHVDGIWMDRGQIDPYYLILDRISWFQASGVPPAAEHPTPETLINGNCDLEY